MANMVREYGARKGKSIFYATASAKNQKPTTVKRNKRKRHKS